MDEIAKDVLTQRRRARRENLDRINRIYRICIFCLSGRKAEGSNEKKDYHRILGSNKEIELTTLLISPPRTSLFLSFIRKLRKDPGNPVNPVKEVLIRQD